MTQGQFLNGVKLICIQFSFSKIGCLTKAKEPRQPYYLPLVSGEEN